MNEDISCLKTSRHPGTHCVTTLLALGFAVSASCDSNTMLPLTPIASSWSEAWVGQGPEKRDAHFGTTSAATGSISQPAYADTSSASAHVQSLSITGNHTALAPAAFPSAFASAGWVDQVTVNVAGEEGQQAIWLIPIQLSGTLNASGMGSLTRFGVEAFVNNRRLTPYGDPINSKAWDMYMAKNGASGIRNEVIMFSWDGQEAWFGASETDQLHVPHWNLELQPKTVYFAVPVVLGTTLNLGVGIDAEAGEAWNPNVANNASFAVNANWAPGSELVDPSGNPIPLFTVKAASGSTYTSAAPVPEPATWASFAAVSCMGWAMARRARRRATNI